MQKQVNERWLRGGGSVYRQGQTDNPKKGVLRVVLSGRPWTIKPIKG